LFRVVWISGGGQVVLVCVGSGPIGMCNDICGVISRYMYFPVVSYTFLSMGNVLVFEQEQYMYYLVRF